MLTEVVAAGRLFMSRGWVLGLLLIALTVGLGTNGFLDDRSDGKENSPSDALYKAISLLAIQTGAVHTTGNWQLEVARWLGLLFWASALLTLLVRLFREPVHRLLVSRLAKDHILLAGLGDGGVKLVENLRKAGRTVVVLEPDRQHPAVAQCRAAGALVLFGKPDDPQLLLGANLTKAAALLALFGDERDCVRTATATHSLLHSERAPPREPPVRCVVRLTEPGMLDVIRRHRIKTDPTDRIQLEILNSHEIAATTMVREAVTNSPTGRVRKVLVLGLGTHHRLGEMVVLRAAKDWLIEHDGRVPGKLQIQVYDDEAEKWAGHFAARYPHLVGRACDLHPHPCWARKVGEATPFDADVDAAFVCVADDGPAVAQAVMLRRVLTAGQPILVRVQHSRSGYGELIGVPSAGWGPNLHAVGLDDALFDPDTATHPELELRAQTIHQTYRRRVRGKAGPANVPWADLPEAIRESNRQLAHRFAEHLAYTEPPHKVQAHLASFQPSWFTRTYEDGRLLFQFTDAEVECLAAREHELWRTERRAKGWTYGEIKDVERKTSPFLVPYSQLTDEQRRHNRDFVLAIPGILALADYAIVANEAATT